MNTIKGNDHYLGEKGKNLGPITASLPLPIYVLDSAHDNLFGHSFKITCEKAYRQMIDDRSQADYVANSKCDDLSAQLKSAGFDSRKLFGFGKFDG